MSSYNYCLLLDAARLQQNMGTAKELNQNYLSLYKGRREENLADVAPYLFTLQKNSEFENWYIQNGWGNAWGLVVQSQFNTEILYRHFQKFLLIKTENGDELYFRFYDPRVLRVFLPTCDTQQLKEFFGPVTQFICEDEDVSFALIFSFNGNKLVTEKVAAHAIFKTTKETEKISAPQSTQGNDEGEKKNDENQQEAKPKRRFFY